MKIYAHRGASAECPENTLAAFRRAIALGVDGIELDIHLSSDGEPVVIHDETVDRTTNGSGPVAGLTVAELRALNAGQGEYVPTLAEVLDVVAGRAHLNIEIKTAAAADAMLRVVASFPQLSWATSSFVWPALEHVHRAAAEVDYWPLSNGSRAAMDTVIAYLEAHPELPQAARWAVHLGEDANTLDRAIALAAALGGTAVSISERALTATDVQAVHDHGLRAWVWTVNDPERARELAAIGVDSICTDDPATLLIALRDRD